MLKRMREVLDRAVFVKRAFILLAELVLAGILYYLIFVFIVDDHTFVAPIVALWLVTAYFLLPRIHRALSKIYLPNYFIGRARTNEGMLGDPVNLALYGTKSQLEKVMKQAGWVKAEELNLKTSLKAAKAAILRKPYKNAPVSSLYLFGNQQDMAFQQEVGGTTSKRHHVRFWRTPKGWLLPGGYRSDWLGAATYDRRVGLSLYTLQITHKIEADIDVERDYVIQTMRDNSTGVSVKTVKDFSSGYHDRNGGGDTIKTDGALPFVDLTKVI